MFKILLYVHRFVHQLGKLGTNEIKVLRWLQGLNIFCNLLVHKLALILEDVRSCMRPLLNKLSFDL